MSEISSKLGAGVRPVSKRNGANACRVLFAAFFVAAPVLATPEPPPAATLARQQPEAVIPPGKEKLLADVLGMGVELPGQCKFTGAQADFILVRSTYRCAEGEVALELRHPDTVPAGAPQTDKLAIVVTSGSPPAGFTDALLERMRAREDDFEWAWVGGSQQHYSFLQAAVAVIGLWLGVGLLWAFFRRARARATPHA